MSLRMTTATTRRDSTLRQMQKRVPADVVALARGRSYPITLPSFGPTAEAMVEITILPVIKLSLRVRDPAAAKARISAINAQLERIFASIRGGAVELSHKQAVSLSGEIYRLVVERFEMNPGESGDWDTWKGFHWAAMEGRLPDPPSVSWREIMIDRNTALGNAFSANAPVLIDVFEHLPSGDSERSLEVHFGLLASWVLARHALEVTPNSRLKLLRQVAEAALDAGWAMKRASEGDYTPDPRAIRFPPISQQPPTKCITYEALFEHWRKETQPSASTLATWKPVIASLRSHVGDDNIERLTADNVRTWKNELVESGRSRKTINDSYLACVQALLSHAVRNGLINRNVAKDIKVRIKQQAGERQLPYEDEEVAVLLALSKDEKIMPRRWLPLLQACTGARAGELAQLWAERVRMKDGVLIMELRPAEDGGTFKNLGSERDVPLHPELIDGGFLEFVKSKKRGPLFYGRNGNGKFHATKGTVNHLGTWIREQNGFQNPRKHPNHAFRHWWKTMASRVDIPDSRADFIQGHKYKGVAGRYRHMDLNTLARDVARIPIPKFNNK